jgi:YD repeat-containing protein
MVNTYTYKPLAGVSIHTTPQKTELRYEYDAYGRLNIIKDQDNKTVKQFNYHYKPSGHANYPYFATNVPRMESSYQFVGDIELLNTFLPGGIDMIYYNTQIPDPPTPYTPNTTTISLNSLPESSLSKINIVSFSAIIWKELIFDFVQDGSIVATRTINLNNTYLSKTIYLLPGKYTVVIKSGPEAYSEYIFTNCYDGNSTEQLKTGDEIQVMGGNTYTFLIFQSD